MRIVTLLLLLLSVVISSTAQYHDNLMFGIKGGANYSLLTNIANTLVNDENKPLYRFVEKNTYSPSVSLFSHYRFKDSQVAIDGRISYYQLALEEQKVSLVSSTIERYNFNYQYMALGIYSKVYLFRGFMAGVGINAGVCLNSSSGIEFESNTATQAKNLQSQEHIRQAIKGRSNIMAGAIMGYDFKCGLSLEASYYYGINDMIETIVNPYNFSECRNNSRSIQFTIGWAISKEGFY